MNTSHVTQRLREYVSNEKSKYGVPNNRLIADYMLSVMEIPMFYNDEQLSKKIEDLFSSLLTKERVLKIVQYQLKNLLYGIASLTFLILNLFATTNSEKRIHILYSLTRSQIKSMTDVREFLSEDRFGTKAFEAGLLIIENRGVKSQCEDNVFLVRDSMCWLYKNKLDFRSKFRCILKIFTVFLSSLVTFKIYKLLFFKQLIIDNEIYHTINKMDLKLTISTTQSQLQRLPSIFYFSESSSTIRNMYWYSDNSWVFRESESEFIFDDSRYLRDFIDNHFCWTKEWCQYLFDLGVSGNLVNSGSILFYKNRSSITQSSRALDIAIFDVTPGVAGEEYDFYSVKVLKDFYLQISEALRAVTSTQGSLRIGIKNKRALNSDLVEWSKLHDAIFIDPEVDLYELISTTRMVIGLPLVSPLQIANELGVPATYFYPLTEKAWKMDSSYAGVSILRTSSELETWIKDVIAKQT